MLLGPNVPSRFAHHAFKEMSAVSSFRGEQTVVNVQRINVERVQTTILNWRNVLRWILAGSVGAAMAADVYGLLSGDPWAGQDIWRAVICLLIIASLWAAVEVMILCTRLIIATLPDAHHVVAATLQELAEDAASEAGLPHIAGGERTR